MIKTPSGDTGWLCYSSWDSVPILHRLLEKGGGVKTMIDGDRFEFGAWLIANRVEGSVSFGWTNGWHDLTCLSITRCVGD